MQDLCYILENSPRRTALDYWRHGMEEDHYEIKVLYHLEHLFTTHPASLTTREQASTVLRLLEQRFPAYEGYRVLMSFVQTRRRDTVRSPDGSIRVIE